MIDQINVYVVAQKSRYLFYNINYGDHVKEDRITISMCLKMDKHTYSIIDTIANNFEKPTWGQF